MNKKISAVAIAVSTALGGMALVGCSNELSYIETSAQPQSVRSWNYTTVDALKDYSRPNIMVGGSNFNSDNDDMLIFQKYDNGDIVLAVYDVKANKIALTRKSTSSELNQITVSEKGIITVITTKGADTTYSVYSRSGRKIYGDSKNVPEFKYDLIIDGNRYYRYDNNGETFASFERKPTAGTLPTNVITHITAAGERAYHKDYYYSTSSIYGGSDPITVSVYNSQFEFSSAWVAPSNAENTLAYVLEDGTLFVQYLVELPSDAKNYDVYVDGEKYDIRKLTVDPETGKTKNVSGDYVVGSVIWNADSDNRIISLDIKNIAAVMKYKDGLLDSAPYMYELKNNGKLGKRLGVYDGQSANIEPLGNGYYTLDYTFGTGTYLLNNKLDVVGDISGITGKSQEFMWNDKGVFTYTLNRFIDLTKPEFEDFKYYRTVGDDPIFRKAGDPNGSVEYKYYKVDYDKFEEIENYEGFIGPWTYTFDELSGMYTYRIGTRKNESFVTQGLVSAVATSQDYGLYMYDNDGTVYVRAARAGK